MAVQSLFVQTLDGRNACVTAAGGFSGRRSLDLAAEFASSIAVVRRAPHVHGIGVADADAPLGQYRQGTLLSRNRMHRLSYQLAGDAYVVAVSATHSSPYPAWSCLTAALAQLKVICKTVELTWKELTRRNIEIYHALDTLSHSTTVGGFPVQPKLGGVPDPKAKGPQQPPIAPYNQRSPADFQFPGLFPSKKTKGGAGAIGSPPSSSGDIGSLHGTVCTAVPAVDLTDIFALAGMLSSQQQRQHGGGWADPAATAHAPPLPVLSLSLPQPGPDAASSVVVPSTGAGATSRPMASSSPSPFGGATQTPPPNAAVMPRRRQPQQEVTGGDTTTATAPPPVDMFANSAPAAAAAAPRDIFGGNGGASAAPVAPPASSGGGGGVGIFEVDFSADAGSAGPLPPAPTPSSPPADAFDPFATPAPTLVSSSPTSNAPPPPAASGGLDMFGGDDLFGSAPAPAPAPAPTPAPAAAAQPAAPAGDDFDPFASLGGGGGTDSGPAAPPAVQQQQQQQAPSPPSAPSLDMFGGDDLFSGMGGQQPPVSLPASPPPQQQQQASPSSPSTAFDPFADLQTKGDAPAAPAVLSDNPFTSQQQHQAGMPLVAAPTPVGGGAALAQPLDLNPLASGGGSGGGGGSVSGGLNLASLYSSQPPLNSTALPLASSSTSGLASGPTQGAPATSAAPLDLFASMSPPPVAASPPAATSYSLPVVRLGVSTKELIQCKYSDTTADLPNPPVQEQVSGEMSFCVPQTVAGPAGSKVNIEMYFDFALDSSLGLQGFGTGQLVLAVQPNASCLREISPPGRYHLKASFTSGTPVVVLRYNVKSAPGCTVSGTASPLMLQCQWKSSEATAAGAPPVGAIELRFAPAKWLQCPLKDLQFLVAPTHCPGHSPGTFAVSGVQTQPKGMWSASQKKLLWKVEELAPTAASSTAMARFALEAAGAQTSAASNEPRVQVKFGGTSPSSLGRVKLSLDSNGAQPEGKGRTHIVEGFDVAPTVFVSQSVGCQ